MPRTGEEPDEPVTAVARGGPVDLSFQSVGQGPAVLLIMGFGATRDGWARTIPTLARRFRVLSFDNRGVGESSWSVWPYSVRRMADDAMAVLDAAGEERAHVYGISLGGMVAQEIALRHPQRVRALVLGATTPGGPRAVLGERPAMTFFGRSTLVEREEAAWAAVPYLYAERTRRRHAERIGEDIARRLPFTAGPVTHTQQLVAAATHSTVDRLGDIRAPTFVVHGGEDAIVPTDNARLLAEGIPGAQLRLWDRAGHLYVTDEPRADREVARFLWRHTDERRGPRGLARRALAAARRLVAHD